MYKIIGADQKEYGPVSTDQLRQWIAEGRINAQTPVKAEGETTWKPIFLVPEFAASFPATPSAATPPPMGGGYPTFDRTRAAQDVAGPAIGLIVTASLGILFELWGIFTIVSGIENAQLNAFYSRFNTAQNAEMMRMMQMTVGPLGIAIRCVGILICLFLLYGALKMKKLESYGLSVAVSILAMIPCVAPCYSPCCIVGLPIGIWALVVLSKPEIKGSFM